MAGPGLEDAGRHATEGRLAESHRDREVAEEPRRRRHPEGVRESLLQDDAESPGSVSFRVVPAESTTYPDLFRIPTFPSAGEQRGPRADRQRDDAAGAGALYPAALPLANARRRDDL